MTVNEPVEKWEIVITELVVPSEGSSIPGSKVFNRHVFKTVDEVAEYFRTRYSVAKSLGYNLQKPDENTFNELVIGRLSFAFSDRMSFYEYEFSSVRSFAQFLTIYPALAKVVNYTIR